MRTKLFLAVFLITATIFAQTPPDAVAPKYDITRPNPKTTAQINSMTRMQEGSEAWNTDTDTMWRYENGAWVDTGAGGSNQNLSQVLTEGNDANGDIEEINDLRFAPLGSSTLGWEIRSQTTGDDLVLLSESAAGSNSYTPVKYKFNDSGIPTDPEDIVDKSALDAAISGISSGDVTAASPFGNDNRLIRSDGTGKGVQASVITISDTGDVNGVDGITATGINVQNGNVNNVREFNFQVTDTEPSSVEGYAYGDDSENRPKYHDGTSFKAFLLEGDVTGGSADGLGTARDVGFFTVNGADSATLDPASVDESHIVNRTILPVDLNATPSTNGQILSAPTGDSGVFGWVDPVVNTDDQTLTLSGTGNEDLTIEDGNTVDLTGVDGIDPDNIESKGTGRTNVTKITDIYSQPYADFIADGAPPPDHLVLTPDAPTVQTVASNATIVLGDLAFSDDRTNDAATITFSSVGIGDKIKIWYNRAAAPAYSGATMKQIPNTLAFPANTECVGVYEVNLDGEIDYYFYEVTP